MPLSPKMLTSSSGSAALLFNTEIVPRQKGIPVKDVLVVEENKKGHRDNQIANAQNTEVNDVEQLYDD